MNADQEFELIKNFVNDEMGIFRKPSIKSKFKYNDSEHHASLKKKFLNSRSSKIKIIEPETITDDALWEFIRLQKSLTKERVNEFAKYHKIAMSVETKLGTLLESFIYKYAKDHDWIWCSGSILQDIDFIKKDIKDNNNHNWIALQVKNSDNSENSASSRVRDGTNIIKWFRRLSKVKNKDNWSELVKIIKSNDKELIENLCEKNYLNYLKS